MIRFSSNGGGGVGVNNAGSSSNGALDNSHGICFSFSNFALLIKKNSPLGRAEAIQCCYMVVVAKALAKEHFFNENKKPISCTAHGREKGATV